MIGETSPLSENAERSEKESRIKKYTEGRNHADADTTSRLRSVLYRISFSFHICIDICFSART